MSNSSRSASEWRSSVHITREAAAGERVNQEEARLRFVTPLPLSVRQRAQHSKT